MVKIKIGIAQISPILGDIPKNTECIIDYIKKAEKDKVNFLIMPELSTIGYGCGDLFLEKVEDNLKAFELIKNSIRDIYCIVGYAERDRYGFLYNSAALIKNGTIVGNYRKVQLVNYRLFDEKRYFRPGSTCPVFETEYGTIGILTCEDMWYPEPARSLVFRGSNVIFILAASPFEWGKDRVWGRILSGRAHDSSVFVVFSNQAGCQDGVTYWGGSQVIGPDGEIIAQCKMIYNDYLVAEIETDDIRRARRRDIRLRDTRRDVIEDMKKAYGVIADGRNYSE